MKEIDIEKWDRKEHFNFFLNSDVPFYNTNFNVDITGLKECVRAMDVSFNTALIYVTMKAALKVKNFRYRYENGKVVEYDELCPSFTHIKQGESLFRFITLGFNDDLKEFDMMVKKAVQDSKTYFDVEELKNGTNFVFISSLPWIPFTGIDHTLSFNKYDTIPRITWGKYFESGSQLLLPYNIQVNHIFIDGLHVGLFYENLLSEIKELITNFSAGR
jgi:chloramphenicol O-acetyltransferase type A